jgi:hypothetical protein
MDILKVWEPLVHHRYTHKCLDHAICILISILVPGAKNNPLMICDSKFVELTLSFVFCVVHD